MISIRPILKRVALLSVALALACGAPPVDRVPVDEAAGEPAAVAEVASTVNATVTIDDSSVSMNQLQFVDEGDYVSVIVSDQPVSPDLELGSYPAEGITGLDFAFVKDPLALDEYLPIMLAHPSVDVLMLEGVELTGSMENDGVYRINLSMAETTYGGSAVSLEVEARLDLGDFAPCESREATIDGADSDPASVLADFYTALHHCDFAAVRALLTESAATEWDAIPEGRRAGMTARAPIHIKIVEVQTVDDDRANVVFGPVPADGTTTGVLIVREGGEWRVGEAEL